jgi:hypothetical protein
MTLEIAGQEKVPFVLAHEPQNGIGLHPHRIDQVVAKTSEHPPGFFHGDLVLDRPAAKSTLQLPQDVLAIGLHGQVALRVPIDDLNAWVSGVHRNRRGVKHDCLYALCRQFFPKRLEVEPGIVLHRPEARRR